LSATAVTVEEARTAPEEIAAPAVRATSRLLIISALGMILLVGFGLRAYHLSAEGLSDDELNKLHAVAEYRAHWLSSTNGEHPFLMKALLTLSMVAADKWNNASVAAAHPHLHVAEETALRLPGVLLGTFTSLLLFLLVAELFGPPTALLAAALWACDPAAIGFNRIAKEDTFLLFFFLLMSVLWLRGRRAAEAGEPKPQRYYWATAAAYGALLASKYMPHLIAIPASYYHIFQEIPATRWRLGRRRWLMFFAVAGAAFVVCNPPILLPATWHEMRVFVGEHRIGHVGYEFMGRLYLNQMTLWLRGIPWYFFYAFMAFKLPLTVGAGFLVGLPLLFTRRLGDSRYFVLFWLFYWFFPFTVLGGKFLRYFTVALPVVLITTAVGVVALAGWLARLLQRAGVRASLRAYAQGALIACALAGSVYASVRAMPHYRLYTNALGGGQAHAGDYFPHDEFYDSGVRDTVAAVAPLARPHARVASETPELFTHYARHAGRADLVSVSLSDPAARAALAPGDIIIVARGRRYFSNDRYVARLATVCTPAARVNVGATPAVNVYVLDEASLRALAEVSGP
jgi:hypothetical protein